MIETNKFWLYRAYDAKGRIVSGVKSGLDAMQIILAMRQTGYQIYDMQTITETEYTVRHKRQRIGGYETVGMFDVDKINQEPQKRHQYAKYWLFVIGLIVLSLLYKFY